MSTAQQRAAAHIDEVFAEGHAIVLMVGGWKDGRDATVTSLDVSEPYPLNPDKLKLARAWRHDRKADARALKAELIRRGLVQ
ncbi:hypothetical protein [Kaistia defluvii]|uniref:Uncharacterized protein n=1 Tax=Kaistia defluvii TaxID=410841 RepID=A0ABV2R1R5_9HYPH